jgi:Flp pilus assembly pilin Flp
MNKLFQHARALAHDEAGSQVVEYALVIGLASIALALTLNSSLGGLAASFGELVSRVSDCLGSVDGTC